MKLPLLISVPHAGLDVPGEIRHLCALTPEEIAADGDEGAREIYSIAGEVRQFVTTTVARAIVDMNRAPDDRRMDGVVKTHTCWNVPVYNTFPSEETITRLLDTWHRPYHERLRAPERGVILGIDCHTMAATGPPVGPDSGARRPDLCLSNAGGTCPGGIFTSLAACLEQAFERRISLNDPFKGGYIIRTHSQTLPWVQLELSRAPFAADAAKRSMLLSALRAWCANHI